MKIAPPHERPSTESAGYLGYYTRTYLPETFDLVDFDGVWPAVWSLRKVKTRSFRIIEEKLHGQSIHDSQCRLYALWAQLIELGVERGLIRRPAGVYVIWNADQLAVPEFPIDISRIGTHGAYDKRVSMDRAAFDDWLNDERMAS